jgi:hypothetical protein
MTRRTLVDEEKVLALIDKIRLVAQGGSGFAKAAVSGDSPKGQPAAAAPAEVVVKVEGGKTETKSVDVIQQAYQIAKEVRSGADKYADEVLTNLESTTSRILRAIKAGRERLSKSIGPDEVESIPLPAKPKEKE